jgi:hypothetical protein
MEIITIERFSFQNYVKAIFCSCFISCCVKDINYQENVTDADGDQRPENKKKTKFSK